MHASLFFPQILFSRLPQIQLPENRQSCPNPPTNPGTPTNLQLSPPPKCAHTHTCRPFPGSTRARACTSRTKTAGRRKHRSQRPSCGSTGWSGSQVQDVCWGFSKCLAVGGFRTTKKGAILRMSLWSQTRLCSDGLNSPKTNANHSPKQEIPPQEGHLHSLCLITLLLRGVALWIGWGGIWVQTRPLRPAAIPEWAHLVLSPNKSLLISDGFGYCPMV